MRTNYILVNGDELMTSVAVDSTIVAFLAYDSNRHELHITYRSSGDVYAYFDVPFEEYVAFLAAESKGTYLNKAFKPKEYRYKVVRRGMSRTA